MSQLHTDHGMFSQPDVSSFFKVSPQPNKFYYTFDTLVAQLQNLSTGIVDAVLVVTVATMLGRLPVISFLILDREGNSNNLV